MISSLLAFLGTQHSFQSTGKIVRRDSGDADKFVTIQVARIAAQEKLGMRVHLRRYSIDAFGPHSLRAKGNDARSRLIVMRILFPSKGIYNGFVTGRGWFII